MKLAGKDIKIKPVLVPDFPRLRDAYIAYCASFGDDSDAFEASARELLSIALHQTDPTLAADPDLAKNVDVDAIEELVRYAAGRLWGEALKAVAEAIPALLPQYLTAAGTKELSG